MIVDAGPLVAYLDAGDEHHESCKALLDTHPGPLLVPSLAIAEAAHLVEARTVDLSVELCFIANFVAGALIPEPVHPADWERIADMVARYSDLPLGIVDASIVAAAERLGLKRIATLDRRHFSVVRPAHVEAFELLP